LVFFEAVELIDAIAQALGIQTLHVVANDVTLRRRTPKSRKGFGTVGETGGGSGSLPGRAGEVAVEDGGPGGRHYRAPSGEGGVRRCQGQGENCTRDTSNYTGEPTGQQTIHGRNPQGVPIVAVG